MLLSIEKKQLTDYNRKIPLFFYLYKNMIIIIIDKNIQFCCMLIQKFVQD